MVDRVCVLKFKVTLETANEYLQVVSFPLVWFEKGSFGASNGVGLFAAGPGVQVLRVAIPLDELGQPGDVINTGIDGTGLGVIDGYIILDVCYL